MDYLIIVVALLLIIALLALIFALVFLKRNKPFAATQMPAEAFTETSSDSQALVSENPIAPQIDIGLEINRDVLTDQVIEEITSLPEPEIKIRRSVVDAGGRPRGTRKPQELKQEPSKNKTRTLKPEFICWKQSRAWIIGLDIPEEYLERNELEIKQNGSSVQIDDEGRARLLEISGAVNIDWIADGDAAEITLRNDNPYLLFRLIGKNLNRGRQVHYATAGSFLAIVPEEWKRDEEISGASTTAPDNLIIQGYKAHYFIDRTKDSGISFRVADGTSRNIPTRASRFELIGNQIKDSSDDFGPLFGQRPPQIRVTDENLWKNINCIVLGEEGTGRKRWRVQFTPEPDGAVQDMPSELSGRESGWYFLRFYDLKENLIESMDFRFANALRDVRISSHPPFPGLTGHVPVTVEFLHDSDSSIELSQKSSGDLSLDIEDTRTVVTIPAEMKWGDTTWKISVDKGAPVETRILMERIWWVIGERDSARELGDWVDTPIKLSRDDFVAASNRVILFRLPAKRWTREIFFGFEPRRARAYSVDVGKTQVSIPLSHFGGAKEIEDSTQDHFLKAWLAKDAFQTSATVGVILADIPITIETKSDVRTQPSARRIRKYLRRLMRRTEDTALHEIIDRTRSKYLSPVSETDFHSYVLETGCSIVLTFEILKESGMKLPRRRKRWLKRLLSLARADKDMMERFREEYRNLKHRTTQPQESKR